MADVVAAVRDRLSAYHGTRVPRSAARLVAWLADDSSHVARFEAVARLIPAHRLAVADPDVELPMRPRQRYESEPPEFMALARTGVDGEQFGVLELAPELEREELPFVDYGPMNYGWEIVHLGSDLGTALAAYLGTLSDEPDRPLELPGLIDGPLLRTANFVQTAHYESAPPGYRFVPTNDRVGVLAPTDAFAAGIPEIGKQPGDDELAAALERAARLLQDGYPASSIALARDVRFSLSYSWDALDRACELWSKAADALGRSWHVVMVDELRRDIVPTRAAVENNQRIVLADIAALLSGTDPRNAGPAG